MIVHQSFIILGCLNVPFTTELITMFRCPEKFRNGWNFLKLKFEIVCSIFFFTKMAILSYAVHLDIHYLLISLRDMKKKDIMLNKFDILRCDIDEMWVISMLGIISLTITGINPIAIQILLQIYENLFYN